MSGYLKDDVNPLTYSITWDVKKKIKTTTTTKTKTKQHQKNEKKKKKNKQNKTTVRHDSTLEVNNTHFNDKWK